MARNTKTKVKSPRTGILNQPSKNSIWDIFKFGESYTSLILGIIVVVIATVTLLTFVKGKTDTKMIQSNQQSMAINSPDLVDSTPTPEITKKLLNTDQKKVTQSPAIIKKQIAMKPNATVKPTVRPTLKPTTVVKPTTIVTKVTPTVIAKKPTIIKSNKIASNTVVNNTQDSSMVSGSTYTVAQGDSLWSIAERKYKSGYNWIDIQKANNLSDANILYVGMKLTLPNVQPKTTTIAQQTVNTQNTATAMQSNKIVGGNYTVTKGDTLWDIAIRAYGDGFAWSKIAQANSLANPSVIHSGNVLTIPRG